jgi:cephalosporin hydroxylase
MKSNASRLHAQARGWKTLRGLHPVPIDLARVSLIRDAPATALASERDLERLLLRLGLNDEGLEEFPAELRPFCGQGLRIWQYPTQFSRYLAKLATLGVSSYLEIGVRHGGSFVATVEVLQRLRPLERAVAVDIIPCPAVEDYAGTNDRIRCAWINTRTPAFADMLPELGTIDLVFIDSHHDEAQCRQEAADIAQHANMIAFHDICNVGCPGVGVVWAEFRRDPAYSCFEYTEQYPNLGPFMGIGLAVRKGRLAWPR